MPPYRLATAPDIGEGALQIHGVSLSGEGSNGVRGWMAEPARGPQTRIQDITGLLERWRDGEDAAFDTLVEHVYTELRQMANGLLRRERDEHTLQPTALVHEAYLRLTGLRELRLRNRRHFYGAAAKAMRRILVDHARHRKALKRGGGQVRHVPIEEAFDAQADDAAGSGSAGRYSSGSRAGGAGGAGGSEFDFERLDQALGALASVAPDKARVVELRYVIGLSVDETATLMEMAPATVKRHWAFARAWLYRELVGPAAS